jgi:hypothetical protein
LDQATRKVCQVMSDDLELPLIAAALAGGIIGASVPMSADEAVVVYNKVKHALIPVVPHQARL